MEATVRDAITHHLSMFALLSDSQQSTWIQTRSIMCHELTRLVRPNLEYCSPAWSPHCNKNKAMIEKVQHRFTRLLLYYYKL